METVEQVREAIFREIISNDSDVRRRYLKHFEADATALSESMAQTFAKWREFDNGIKNDERRGYISALAYVTITLHVSSMKLLLSGQTIAAGNLLRQVIESIALALLCSAKDLDVLKRFMEDKYSANDAIRDLLKHHDKLSLKVDALTALKKSQEFCHNYSHITRMTIAVGMSLSENGRLYKGVSFDEGKLEQYRKEVNHRVGLAKVLPNVVDAVAHNVAKW